MFERDTQARPESASRLNLPVVGTAVVIGADRDAGRQIALPQQKARRQE